MIRRNPSKGRGKTRILRNHANDPRRQVLRDRSNAFTIAILGTLAVEGVLGAPAKQFGRGLVAQGMGWGVVHPPKYKFVELAKMYVIAGGTDILQHELIAVSMSAQRWGNANGSGWIAPQTGCEDVLAGQFAVFATICAVTAFQIATP